MFPASRFIFPSLCRQISPKDDRLLILNREIEQKMKQFPHAKLVIKVRPGKFEFSQAFGGFFDQIATWHVLPHRRSLSKEFSRTFEPGIFVPKESRI